MRATKLAGIVAAPFLAAALAVSAGASVADHSDHPSSVSAEQHGANKNGTEQDAHTWAKTEQSNDNSPIHVGNGYGDSHDHGKGHGPDSDHHDSDHHDSDHHDSDHHDNDHKVKNGNHVVPSSDVDQTNDADTASESTNSNATKQKLDQEQTVEVEHRFTPKHDRCHKDHHDLGHMRWAIDSSMSDHGHGHGHGHKCDRSGKHGHDGGSSDIDATQKGSNDNWTDQDAHSSAKTDQANINAPIGSGHNGNVEQSNDAGTTAESSNDNETEQKLDQDQSVESSSHGSGHGHGSGGDVDATQKGHNDNFTDQNATSKATTLQVNIYAPITVFSKNYRSGDVIQSNDADTTSTSSNDNFTKQKLGQDQSVNSSGNGDVNVEQSGKNRNGTEQDASSKAETLQVNIYAPISVFSDGSTGGDVNQSNFAGTSATSTNTNDTHQTADQAQAVGAVE